MLCLIRVTGLRMPDGLDKAAANFGASAQVPYSVMKKSANL